MSMLRELPLQPVGVRADASFLEAARLLLESRLSAIAVLDDADRVAGLFTDDDLLRGLFPRYLEELHHTAFLGRDGLQATLQAVAAEKVARYMREPVSVDIDAGAAHVVERFLHTPWGAIAVVEADRFVGMLDQLEFTRRLLGRLDVPDDRREMG
jgi:CBS domain-containing protein